MAPPGTDLGLYGIPAAQIAAFALTIVVAYFSARWASAESRKQFQKKNDDEERTAAAALIPLLMRFAAECDRRLGNISTFIASDGHAGSRESIAGIPFPEEIHSAAAKLGARITERAIKLEITQHRAESYMMDASDFADADDYLDHEVISFMSLLSLRARYLVDMAAERIGLNMRHSDEEMDRLRKQSMKFAHEIDSADETKWN
jgi:hypothetical protein